MQPIGGSKPTQMQMTIFHTLNNKTMNYSKLMELKPTHLGFRINQLKQRIDFYEHPKLGQDAEVIAVCHKLQVAGSSGFYDMSDFDKGSDYLPCYKDEKFQCAFEL